MDISYGINIFNHHTQYQNSAHQQEQGDAHSSANTQPQRLSPIEPKRLQQYTQETIAKHHNVQDAVNIFDLHYNMPFDQEHFQKLIYQKFPEALKATPPIDRYAGICLGLSMVWLKQRLDGKSDNDFHQSILNPEHDAALLQVFAAQHVEQAKCNTQRILRPNSISETVAPKLGMNLIPVSKTQTSRVMPITPMHVFAHAIDHASQQPRQQQGLLLLTDDHAMALLRDNQNSMHFFDPNCGVISSPEEKRPFLYALMSNLMENSYASPNQYSRVYVTEVQIPPKPASLHLHTLNLLNRTAEPD